MHDWSFHPGKLEGYKYATGHLGPGKPIPGGILKFPSFAAEGMGTPTALAQFWKHLVRAYHDKDLIKPISHVTARAMLADAHDKGSVEFMNARMGLGVFIMRAGDNRIACHQAANDGFRG